MEEIRDCKGRLACKVDPESGVVETVYKGCRTRTQLSVGSSFTIEREGVETNVILLSSCAFQVKSRSIQPCL